MNWKKILAFVAASFVAGGIAPWAQGVASGQHIPFTVGTVVAPGIVSLAAVLAALFTKPPHQP